MKMIVSDDKHFSFLTEKPDYDLFSHKLFLKKDQDMSYCIFGVDDEFLFLLALKNIKFMEFEDFMVLPFNKAGDSQFENIENEVYSFLRKG